MSSHPLEERLIGLRRRVRRVLWFYGLSWMLAVFLGLVLLFGWGDWLFHFDDSGVRAILLVAVLGAAAWAGWRYLITPLTVPFENLDVARRIEDRYPGLQDSLASTVEFLQRGQDPLIGSPALQQAVIQQTLMRVGRLDFDSAIQTRPLRKAAAIACGVCLLALLTGLFHRTNSHLAVWRLFAPWNAPAWPRQTNLRLLHADLRPITESADAPLRLAKGNSLEFFAENSTGSLPSRVTLEYRPLEPADGKVVSELLRPTSTRDKSGTARELAAGHLPSQKGSLEFRVVGGDDQTMPWRKVQVIPPPVVEELHVTLTPPAYTRMPVEHLPSGVGHIQGYLGTRVEFSARINKPIKTAVLRVKDVPLPATQISGDGRQVTASFTISEAGTYSYQLELKDTEGFEGGDPPRYEIRGIQDLVPEVVIDLPSSDLQVTPAAEVQVQATAKDDLGLKGLRLVYRVGGEDAGENATANPQVQVIPLLEGPDRPQQHTAKYLWKLDGLKLAAGMRIVFHAEAGDDFDLGPAHLGRSVPRTLIVVTPRDKGRELAQRQANLLEELQRTTKLQENTRQQINELKLQMQKVGKLQPVDLDTLQRAELAQRQVAAQLTNPADGLQNAARDILNDLQANRLKEPEVERRAARIDSELGRLGSEQLPVIEQELTRAKKQAEAADRQTPGDNRGQSPDSQSTPGSSDSKNSPQKNSASKSDAKNAASEKSDAAGESDASQSKEQSASKVQTEKDGKSGQLNSKNSGKTSKPAAKTSESSNSSAGSKSSTGSESEPKEQKSASKSGAEAGAESKSGKSESNDSAGFSAEKQTDDKQGTDSSKTGPSKSGKQKQDSKKSSSSRSNKSNNQKNNENSNGQNSQDALDRVAENQREVVDTLKELTQELSQWRFERETADDVADLINQQKEINKQVGELGQKSGAKSRDELSPQELADIAKAAERQKRQAEKLEQLEGKMQQQSQQQDGQNPTTAATLRNALEQSRQSATAGQMRDAAGQINENRLGSAAQTQQDVLRKLSDMLETLQNRRTGDTETLVKKMKQAEQELDTLRSRQRSLQEQTRQAQQHPDPQARKKELERLGKEQAQVREQMKQLARQLERLQLHRASEAARRAAGRMEQAQQNLEQAEPQQAAEQQQETLDDLEQAQRETARARREAEEQLAQEQLEKISDQLQAMIGREQAVIDETKRLEGLRVKAGRLTRAQLRALSDLTENQQNLQKETERLVKQLSAAEAFALALKGAARQMKRAAEMLGERQTGEPTQRAEEAARQRFVDLIAAMKPDQKSGGKSQNQSGEGAGKQNGPPGEGISGLAQLKILKALQQELLDRTMELGRKRGEQKGELTAAQQQELDDIARDQGAVADLARNLMQQALDNAEDEEEAEEKAGPVSKESDPPAKKTDDNLKSRKSQPKLEEGPSLKKAS